jgi:hypothetical protein
MLVVMMVVGKVERLDKMTELYLVGLMVAVLVEQLVVVMVWSSVGSSVARWGFLLVAMMFVWLVELLVEKLADLLFVWLA